MVSEVISGMTRGVEGQLVEVQADISSGLPLVQMIGYLSGEVREAKDRVRTALRNAGYCLPPKRISINLAPASVKKYGTSFDLAIAVALLSAMGAVRTDRIRGCLFLGELALDGTLCSVPGVLPIVQKAGSQEVQRCIVPEENALEAGLCTDIPVYAFHSVSQVIDYINHGEGEPFAGKQASQEDLVYPDFKDVRGQEEAKRALEIAAAGFHHVLLEGPPGVGKSMLSSCLPGILPAMEWEEMIETTMISSVKGLYLDGFIPAGRRPFRAPAHNISKAGMFGGGRKPLPGEVSLAHHGVLFLDEITEYDRGILEMFRIPLEDHEIRLVRNEAVLTFPADFVLIAASNPCPCGHYPSSRCSCSQQMIQRYRAKLSGPILDRIDLFVRCNELPFEVLTGHEPEEASSTIRSRVEKAIQIQKERFAGSEKSFNGHMDRGQCDCFCQLDEESTKLMQEAYRSLGLSGRSYYRVIRVARTIADLEGSDRIRLNHLEEALHYRRVEV